MIVEPRHSDSPVTGRASVPVSCACGHLGRFRLDLARAARGRRPASAQCEICGGWQSMSTILCYAALKQRGQRLSAVVLAGLVATTLAGQALEYLGSPLNPAPHVQVRSA